MNVEASNPDHDREVAFWNVPGRRRAGTTPEAVAGEKRMAVVGRAMGMGGKRPRYDGKQPPREHD